MSESVYVSWMREDNGSRKYGMMDNLYDPIEQGHDELQEMFHFSPWHRTVYRVTRHDREEKGFYWNGYRQLGPKNSILEPHKPEFKEEDPDYRASALMLDDSKAAASLKDADFESKMKNGQPLAIIDCRGRKAITKDSSTVTFFPEVKAIHTIASGTYTHGTAGDYADIISLKNDLATLTGLLTATTISSQTLAGPCVFSSAFSGNSFVIDSNAPHGGDPLAGWTISLNADNHLFQTSTVDTGTFEVKDISLTRIANATNTLFGLVVCQKTAVMHSAHDLFLDGGGFGGSGIWTGTSAASEFYNLSIRDFNNWGFYHFLSTGIHKLEQVFVEGCGTGIDVNLKNATYINVCAGDNSVTDFLDTSAATGFYPMSVDASATNANWNTCTTGIPSIPDLSAEYELNPALATYANVLAGAPNAASSLTSPTLSANLMDVIAWIKEIGCKSQLAAPASGPPLGSLSLLGVGR